MTRDELAKILRASFKGPIVEAASHGGVRPGKPLESIAKMAREVLDSETKTSVYCSHLATNRRTHT